jgi:hypothetical protein
MKKGDHVYKQNGVRSWFYYGDIVRVNSTSVIIQLAPPPYERNKTNEDIKDEIKLLSVPVDRLDLIAGFDTFNDYELID